MTPATEEEAKGKTETHAGWWRATGGVVDLRGRRLHLHHLRPSRALPSRQALGECYVLLSTGEKKPPVRHPTTESGAEHRVRARCDALQREILEFAKLAVLLASLEYAAGAAGAAVRGKELLGYAARVVRFSVERADRRIRSSNSGVDRHRKISVIYTGCAPAVSPVDGIVRPMGHYTIFVYLNLISLEVSDFAVQC